ncbi:hypothetical protein Taro_039856 [Colocasia esculenta]|uniref:Uncharacterized protein n=1 Tax=Colocasia esculenta TaxID=4460 RepID=A0A843W7H5_COLES|nr:hypothetical protein [Colocasia esculenta]
MAVLKKGTSALLARPCRVAIRWLAFQQGPSVSCRRVLLLLLGAHAASVVAISLVLRLGFVVDLRVRAERAYVWCGLHRCRVVVYETGRRCPYLVGCPLVVGVCPCWMSPSCWGVSLLDVPLLLGCVLLAVCLALRACVPLGVVLCSVDVVARAKQMFVSHIAPLVERCNTYLLRCITWLPCVLVRFPKTFGCCPGEVRSQDCSGLISASCCATSRLGYAAVVLAVAFWWVFLERHLGGSGGGSPRTSCVASAGVCVLSVGYSAWVPSVKGGAFDRVSGRDAGQLCWWDFVCPCGLVVCFISHALHTLPDGGLVDVLSSTSAVVSFPVQVVDVLSCLALSTSDVFLGFASVPVPVEQVF